ncbi:MAG: leucine-rich repeat domain-containing protein [Bacteroidetes bacterium]|nr:leucine-rich repeat domain-containing protein [Bacteroidota bacterium]
MKILNLSGSKITEIDWLWNLTNLQFLGLGGMRITDIFPLAQNLRSKQNLTSQTRWFRTSHHSKDVTHSKRFSLNGTPIKVIDPLQD